jgi:hypothetical protein
MYKTKQYKLPLNFMKIFEQNLELCTYMSHGLSCLHWKQAHEKSWKERARILVADPPAKEGLSKPYIILEHGSSPVK